MSGLSQAEFDQLNAQLIQLKTEKYEAKERDARMTKGERQRLPPPPPPPPPEVCASLSPL